MSKLILMRGLPGSGKSTKAEELSKASGNTMRLNRDLLRQMLHFNKWTPRNEKFTIAAEKELAKLFLREGKNVIIDDTNLTKGHVDMWAQIAKESGVQMEQQISELPLKECIERDSKRENPVGEYVIKNMALKYKWGADMEYAGDIIVDIDGTLADITHRRSFVQGEKKDWKNFFYFMGQDTPRMDVVDFVKDFSKTYNIILVSGRPEDYRDVTERWLKLYKIPFWTLIMRGKGDSRPDTIVKQEILDKYLNKEAIKLVIDDRPSVIRMWRSNGIPTLDVGDGEEF